MSLTRLTNRFAELRRHPGYRRNPAVVLGRAAAWSLHCALRIPARARFRRWNFRLHLPPKWSGGGCTSPYLFREHYEPELALLERFLQPGMVFVDGGANTGVFTFTAAQLVGPSGRVVAFEPGAACFQALNESAKLNCSQHVCLRNQAISNSSGTARLYHHDRQENSFSLGGGGDVGFEEVEITTLDRMAEEEGLARIDFIKLDVEGAEEFVLRGAAGSLERWRPIVLFEVNPQATARLKLSADGACSFLTNCGYHLFEMDEGGALSAIELMGEFGNVLAVPAERVEELALPTASNIKPEAVAMNCS